MKKYIRIAFVYAFLLSYCGVLQLKSQELMPPSMKGDIPSSPQGSAFVKLGEYEAKNAYGTPDISIPLFTIDYHGYQIPFNLKYEAQPLHPGYSYDVYGLGWALSGNSCISRTIHDIADEYGDNDVNFRIESFTLSSGETKKYYNYTDRLDLINGKLDDYKIVFPNGRVVPFYMYKDDTKDSKLKFDLIPIDNGIKITCDVGVNSINSFIVVDEMGIIYSFDVADKATGGYRSDRNYLANVTWLLSKITIPGKGEIKYEYNDAIKWYDEGSYEPYLKISRANPCSFYDYTTQFSEAPYQISSIKQEQYTSYHVRLLKSIRFDNSSIDFSYDQRYIKKIIHTESSQCRTYNFDFNNKKQLNKLTIGDKDKLTYMFEYTPIDHGRNTDHWGNYNCWAKNNPSSKEMGNFIIYVDNSRVSASDMQHIIDMSAKDYLLLLEKGKGDFTGYLKLKLQGANSGDCRGATPPEKHGVLRRITYPNGGYTDFKFENHRFLTATCEDGKFEYDKTKQRIIDGGGFRIKSIVNYDADGKEASRDEYRYGYTYEQLSKSNIPFPISQTQNMGDYTGCGEAVVDPNVLTYMNFEITASTIPSGFLKMITGLESGFNNINEFYIESNAYWWTARFSASNFRKLLGGRPPVVYPEITIFHGGLPSTKNTKCIGKKVMSFDIYNDGNGPRDYMYQVNSAYCPGVSYKEIVRYEESALVTEELPAKVNRLVSETTYAYCGVAQDTKAMLKVSSDEYTYHEYNLYKASRVYNNAFSAAHCEGTWHHNLAGSTGANYLSIPLFTFFSPITERKGVYKIASKTTKRYSKLISTPLTTKEWYGYDGYVYGDKISSKNYYYNTNKEDIYNYIGKAQSQDIVVEKMKAKNMLAFPVNAYTTISFMGEARQTAGYQIDYGEYGNNIYPQLLYEFDGKKYEKSIEVLSYTAHGNPREVIDLKTGLHTTYLWGYNDRYMIAEVQGATYGDVKNYEESLISNPSIANLNNTLRSKFTNAMIQTWEHSPLNGISAYTNAQGQTFKYYYDELGRLTKETRIGEEEETIKTYEYNFKN